MGASGAPQSISKNELDPDLKRRQLALYSDANSYLNASQYTPYPGQQVQGFQPLQTEAQRYLTGAILPGAPTGAFDFLAPQLNGPYQAPQFNRTEVYSGPIWQPDPDLRPRPDPNDPGGGPPPFNPNADPNADPNQLDPATGEPYSRISSPASVVSSTPELVTLDSGQTIDMNALRSLGIQVENRGTATQPNLVIAGSGVGNGSAMLQQALASQGYTGGLSALQQAQATPDDGVTRRLALQGLYGQGITSEADAQAAGYTWDAANQTWRRGDSSGTPSYQNLPPGVTFVNGDTWTWADGTTTPAGQDRPGFNTTGLQSPGEVDRGWQMANGYQPGTTRGDLAAWARDNGLPLPPTEGGMGEWADQYYPGGSGGAGVPQDFGYTDPLTGTALGNGGTDASRPAVEYDRTQQGVGFGQMYDAADATASAMGYQPSMVGTDFLSGNVQAQNVTPGSYLNQNVGAYMNPYTTEVIDRSISDLDRARKLAMVDNASGATRAGAFGGSRHGVIDAETNRGFLDTVARTSAQLRNAGFEDAAGRVESDMQRKMQAGLANQGAGLTAGMANQGAGLQAQGLGLQAGMANQGAGLQGNAQALAGAGQLGRLGQDIQGSTYQAGGILGQLGAQQQAMAQGMTDADIQQFYEARNDPLRGFGLLQGILQGMPAGMNQTTYAPQSRVQGFAQGAIGGAGVGASLGGPAAIPGALIGGGIGGLLGLF